MTDDKNSHIYKDQHHFLYMYEHDVSLNPRSVTTIGKTIESDRFPNTMDGFWFVIYPNIIINPFDLVTVRNIYDTKTIGIIKEIVAVSDNHYASLAIPFQSANNEYKRNSKGNKKRIKAQSSSLSNNRTKTNGVLLAKVAVMANTGAKLKGKDDTITIGLPVGVGKSVMFATAEDIMFALGIPEMENPVPVGIIETSNGLQVPITLDISYLVGPDTAHVNASGISGNQKTSYLLFLLQSACQALAYKAEETDAQQPQGVALIIFNTKEDSLLHIDQEDKNIQKRNKNFFNILELDIKPFNNVTYYLPRGNDGKPNSLHIPKNSKTYSYELNDIYDRLELLFSEAYDPHYNLSSIIDYIYESWPINSDKNNIDPGKQVTTWTDLYEFRGYPYEIMTHKSTLLHFLGHLQMFRKSPMFIDKRKTSIYLGNEIKQIKSGDVFVIDVATISSVEEQGFVVGDLMKSIDEMYSTSHYYHQSYMSSENETNGKRQEGGEHSIRRPLPKYILIFIDEINRFLPLSSSPFKANLVAEEIMKTLIAGRSRGTILFSAQQFKSTTDYRLHQNTGLQIIAKLGISELSAYPYYSMIDESTKMNIVRLHKGELVMIHSAFRHPIKVTFPTASFRRM
jgi:hypothetical protein